MISDHLQPWTRRQGQSGHVWTTIGAIANATEAIELGTGVTAMIHRAHPINVAQAAATAAVMLDGRFFLGVGSGERLNEQPFGRRWPGAGERLDRVREGIEIVRSTAVGRERQPPRRTLACREPRLDDAPGRATSDLHGRIRTRQRGARRRDRGWPDRSATGRLGRRRLPRQRRPRQAVRRTGPHLDRRDDGRGRSRRPGNGGRTARCRPPCSRRSRGPSTSRSSPRTSGRRPSGRR